MTLLLAHTDTPADVISKAESIGARAIRVRRWLTQPSHTGATRRSAKDELASLLKEAGELWSAL